MYYSTEKLQFNYDIVFFFVSVSDRRSSMTTVLGYIYIDLSRANKREKRNYVQYIEQVEVRVQERVDYVYVP